MSRKGKIFKVDIDKKYNVDNTYGNLENDQTHIYYNIRILNNNTSFDRDGNPTSQAQIVPCNYVENRANEFIANPSKYESTIVQFGLQSNSFPVQIVQPLLGTSPDGDGYIPTVYQVGINYDGMINYETINWKPADITLNPPPIVTASDINKEYFWNYSFNYFLDAVNQALNNLWVNYSGESSPSPFMTFDGNTQLFSIYLPQASGKTKFISFNQPLFNLFTSFPFTYSNEIFTAGGYDIPLENIFNAPTVAKVVSGPDGSKRYQYTVLTQEYPSVQILNPVVSVVITAPHSNLVNELIGVPVVYGTTPYVVSNNAQVLNILFEYGLGRRNDPMINYQPISQYITSTLIGINPVQQMQINVFWKDEYGMLHPFFLEQGGSFYLKILFRKKTFYA
jgi:hypothetical protein